MVTSTSMSAIRPKLEKIFAIHGIPDLVKSDNGLPFDSHAFEDYAKEKRFIHRSVTPLWPEANGIVERFMQPLVKSARASAAAGQSWKNEIYTFVANYRATPRSSTNATPHQLLMNRSVKVKLPQVSIPTYDLEVIKRDTTEKQKIKVYADSRRNAKPHHFRVDDPISVKQKKSNKLSTPFDPKPYIITKVKGSMITAKRISDGKNITRNSSQCCSHLRSRNHQNYCQPQLSPVSHYSHTSSNRNQSSKLQPHYLQLNNNNNLFQSQVLHQPNSM